MTATAVRPGLLHPLLSRLPARLLKALDAWSYRIAQQRAQKRRDVGARLARERRAS